MKSVRGNTLIELLVVIAIIAILAAGLYKGTGIFGANSKSPRKDARGATTLGLAELAAKDEVCRSNINQVRMAIEMAENNNDGTPPARLEDTHLGSDFYKCPLGGEHYVYDPTTGKVYCPHPGHEKF